MDLILELHEKARRRGKRVVLPESADERVVQAAGRLASEGLVHPVLVEARGMAAVPPGVETVRPASDPRLETFAEALFERRKAKGMTLEQARERLLDPLWFGAALVASGDCDGGGLRFGKARSVLLQRLLHMLLLPLPILLELLRLRLPQPHKLLLRRAFLPLRLLQLLRV